jgi:hypothetical protein
MATSIARTEEPRRDGRPRAREGTWVPAWAFAARRRCARAPLRGFVQRCGGRRLGRRSRLRKGPSWTSKGTLRAGPPLPDGRMLAIGALPVRLGMRLASRYLWVASSIEILRVGREEPLRAVTTVPSHVNNVCCFMCTFA